MSPLTPRRVGSVVLGGLAVVGLILQLTVVSRILAGDVAPVVSDLGRDLLGAGAVADGQIPYQRLGELVDGLPDRWSDQWVAHSPLSIAVARGLASLEPEAPELLARWLGLLGLVVLTCWLARGKWTAAFFLGAAWAAWTWFPTLADLYWVQTASVAALALAGALVLDRREARPAALALLGLIVAWKPWMMVFAAFLPRSRSVWRDVTVVAGWAIVFTLVVLPWAGGTAALWSWITEALPANLVVSKQTYGGGYGFTGLLSSGWASAAYGLVVILCLLGRRRLPRTAWPTLAAAAHLVAAPLVWDHYWLAVLPAVLWPVWTRTAPPVLRVAVAAWLGIPVALSVLALGSPPGLRSAIGMGLGLSSAVLAWGLLATGVMRPGGATGRAGVGASESRRSSRTVAGERLGGGS